MDEFLSRKMKNWAAQQRPPGDGRERLLEAAALQAVSMKVVAETPATPRLEWLWVVLDYFNFPVQEDIIRPLTHTSMWSFHLAVSSLRVMV